jgi:hypothetical protein
MNILNFVLREAHIEKWALLQQQQLDNMVHQVFAKYKEKLINKKPDDTYFLHHSYTDYVKELKKPYFEYAKKFNEHVVKKLTIDFKNEKLLLIWLLEQVVTNQIKAVSIDEDVDVIKNNLHLYFENKGKIHKNIFDSTYNDLKKWVVPYQPKGEESKHKKFLSKPYIEGKEYKIYKITKVDECVKISKGTSWCTQGIANAESYLKKGPLWLVTKNDKRFALISFESGSYMDVNDQRLKPEVVFEIFDIWPEAEKKLIENLKGNSYSIKFLRNLSEEQQLEMMPKEPDVFQHLYKPTEKVINKAVKEDGSNIQYVKNPSKELQEEAIKQDADNIERIDHIDPEIEKRLIDINPDAIKHMKNPSEETQEKVVRLHGLAIKHIKDPSEKVKLLAVKQNGKAIRHLKDPSVEVQMAAVNNKWHSLAYIKNPDKKVIERAIEIDPRAEEFVDMKAI